MCAKLFLCNYGIESLVLDNCRDNIDYIVRNYCGFLEITKKQLLHKIQTQIASYEKDFLICENVEKISVDKNICLFCQTGKTYSCEYLLICNGFVYKRLNILDHNNKYISSYLDCNDLEQYKNKHVVIIGGGDRTVTYLECLYTLADKITILCRSYKTKINFYLEKYSYCNKILKVYNNVSIDSIDEKIFFTDKKSKQNFAISYEFVISAIGIDQNTIPLFYNGKLVDIYNSEVTGCNETKINNVFLAGVTKKSKYQQIVNVMHDGSVFAMEIRKRIMGKEDIYFE